MSVVVSEAGKSGSIFSIISLASSQRQQSFLVRISICILILKQPTQPLLAAGGVRPLSIPKVICYKLVNYSLLKKPEIYTPLLLGDPILSFYIEWVMVVTVPQIIRAVKTVIKPTRTAIASGRFFQ